MAIPTDREALIHETIRAELLKLTLKHVLEHVLATHPGDAGRLHELVVAIATHYKPGVAAQALLKAEPSLEAGHLMREAEQRYREEVAALLKRVPPARLPKPVAIETPASADLAEAVAAVRRAGEIAAGVAAGESAPGIGKPAPQRKPRPR